MSKKPSKKRVYICSSFIETNIANLYLEELFDHYTVINLNIERVLDDPTVLILNVAGTRQTERVKIENVSERIYSSIKKADIVVCLIENYSYHYSESLIEIGMAVALNKPIIIFDSSTYQDTADGDIPGISYKGNIVLPSMPIYWSKMIVHTTSWQETKNTLEKISRLVTYLENQSDSD